MSATTSVTVTEISRRGRKVFQLRRRIGDKVERKFFDTFAGAEMARLAVVDQLERKGTESFTQSGVSVREAWREFERRRLPSLRGNHARLVRWWMGEFVTALGVVSLSAIDARAIDSFLARPAWSSTTRAQGYVYLRLFFNWLVRYDFLERSPVLKAEAPRAMPEHHLLTLAQVRRLLELTEGNPRLRAWLALGLFGGMRQSEVGRAQPDHVLSKDGEIFVPITKTTAASPRPRYVPILPALKRHLPKSWDHLGEDFIKRQRNELVEAMGWKEWPQNCLRHTAASMHLARWQDAGKTAFFLGHSSPQMVGKTYARAVRHADAVKFWAL